jgi:hypothetical protein
MFEEEYRQIVRIIRDEWINSKFGSYLIENSPQWIKDLTPEKSTPIDGVANRSADRILKLYEIVKIRKE